MKLCWFYWVEGSFLYSLFRCCISSQNWRPASGRGHYCYSTRDLISLSSPISGCLTYQSFNLQNLCQRKRSLFSCFSCLEVIFSFRRKLLSVVSFLRILLTLDSIFRVFRSTRRLRILSKNFVCDMGVILQEELITYKSLVQEATCEYRDLVHSKWWELSTSQTKSRPTFTSKGTHCGHRSVDKQGFEEDWLQEPPQYKWQWLWRRVICQFRYDSSLVWKKVHIKK